MIQSIRGMHDIFGDEMAKRRYIINTVLSIAQRYGFQEIETPILEPLAVFQRSLGEASDVIAKEMYTLSDRGGEVMAMRPEGTAGVARAFLNSPLTQTLPQRFFYTGPMFRYERPQKGRQRQFHQIGIETIGAQEPEADIEAIALAAHTLQALNILPKTTLVINSLGDNESRARYRDVLIAYFQNHRTHLSEDSLRRLELNPLRILDSKDSADREIVAGAPLADAYRTPTAQAFFETVCAGLSALNVSFAIDPRLVRGLDYYVHTAFEFIANEGLGAQGTVLGGGRYDGLTETLGGKAFPGVGWAAGLERLVLLETIALSPPSPIAVAPLGDDTRLATQQLVEQLRHQGLHVHVSFTGNLGKRLQKADKAGAYLAVLVGAEEWANGHVIVRDLRTSTQTMVPLADLTAHLNAQLQKPSAIGQTRS